jgi:hypothetical protein
MSMIRLRSDEDLTAPAGVDPAAVGGFVSGDRNTLTAPGSADMASLRVAPTTHSESAVAALRETIAAKMLRGYEYLSIPAEPGFEPVKALGDKMQQYDGDELSFLGDARSTAELNQRLGQVTSTRQNLQNMAAHPGTAMAASLLDVDAVIGLGVGKLATATRTARLIAGLTANSAALGLASEGGHITAMDVIGTSLGVALGAVPKTLVRTAEATGDAAEVAARTATVDSRATAAGLAQTDTSIKVRVPDPDYVAPKPDVSTTRPYVEVNRSGRKNAPAIQTSTRNFMEAVLTHGDDLPEGVRVLGRALVDSLARDGDVPLVLRRARPGADRSNVSRDGVGGLKQTELRTVAGAADTLTDTVRGMSTYERTIALHEAAHAKTIQNIDAFHAGTLADGPVKEAIGEIDRLRNIVRENVSTPEFLALAKRDGSPEYNVMYGVKNNHEFISQLFNSESFRSTLQGIKVRDYENLWSALVQRVVQAFTGKLPADTAFDQLVKQFDVLLQHPRDPNIKGGPAAAAPMMQSELLQNAPTAQLLAAKTGGYINKNFALYDAIKSIGPRAATLADQLVVDATGTAANSATHYARAAHLGANVAMAQVDGAISQAMSKAGWGTFSRMRNPVRYKAAQRELSDKVYAQLADNHTRYRNGAEILPHPDPAVESVVKAFADSRWAEDSLDRIKVSGMTGSEKIDSSPYYLPRQHSADKVGKFLRDNPNVTRADVEGMYGAQFLRMFADKGMEEATAKALGKSMLRNMEQRSSGTVGYRQHVAGMSDDDIEFAMRNAGIEDEKVAQFLETANRAGTDANTVRNLRRRAEFNMTEDYVTKSGALIHPQLFVNKDVMTLMEGYSRNMSGRVGLAKAGFPDAKSIAAAVDSAAAEAVDPRAAAQTLDNTVNQLMGYPTGENVPDILRSFSIVSSAVQLANSGIFQLADSALLIKQFGITKTLGALGRTAWGKGGLDLAKSEKYGARLRDIIEARNVLSGRYRTVMTHLDDNTDIGTMGISHQMIQQMGQGVRFVNGMEYVRRGQSKLVAGLIGDSIDDAIAGSSEAATSLARFGLTPELLSKAQGAMKASPDLRDWPSSIRFDMEAVGHNMADALVQENRLGEIPAWMQFSALGKFILPYMNFVAGTWNKILRRTYTQDGATGVAMMAAYQLPLQMVSSAAVMGLSGKDVTPGALTANVMTQMPLMSWAGFAVNMLTQGPTNSIAALGMVDKAYAASASIVGGDPDPSQIIRAVPFLSILPGIRMMATAMDDDDE